jgi:hypothetical protein
MSNALNGLLAVATAIVGLAIVAVLVSNSANTSGVITSAGNALSTGIKAAVSPVTSGTGLGSTQSPVESYYA